MRDGDQIAIGDEGLKFHEPLKALTAYKNLAAKQTVREVENVPCWLLVADICDFAPLSRSMPGEALDILLGEWFSTCKEIIERHNGHINKYLGDGFLAYWSEVATSPTEIADAIIGLKEFQQKRSPTFRIVVHFGSVAIGGVASMGEESLLGKEVNVIFRLEKLAGSLGEECGLSEAAHTKLGDLLPARSLGEHELKGFERKRALFGAT